MLRENKFRHAFNHCKIGLGIIATIWVFFTNVDAANFLYFWKASSDPSVSAYGIYQRTGDSSYIKIDEVSVQDLDNPAKPSYLVTGTDGNSYRERLG